jgi:hypothetical protein
MVVFSAMKPTILARMFFDRLEWVRCRQLFRTKEGRLGLMMRGVQSGDIVIILDGLPVVHVLRPLKVTQDGKQLWQFVGNAYVHGMMNGEVDELGIESISIVLE